MSITRDPTYPAEFAQLMQAFNRCSDGFGADVVLNASLQMVAASIGFIASSKGCTLQQALDYEAHISATIRKEITVNWKREHAVDDIEVKSQ